MFDETVDRQQMLSELRRRMAVLGPGREKVGAALQPEEPEPTETVVGSGRPPLLPRPGPGAAAAAALAAAPLADDLFPDDAGPIDPSSSRSGELRSAASSLPLSVSSSLSVSTGGEVRGEPASGAVFAVPEPLAAVLPQGGLPRGGVVSLAGGTGSTSLLLSLLAAPEGTWSALVGLPGVGLAAAAEFGVDLDRTVLIPDPGPDVLQVLSVLADGVDLLVVGAPAQGFPAPARLRVLTGRLRQRGATLLVVGAWPGADLVLRTRVTGWAGIADGHGRLRDRSLEISVGGRRAATTRRSVQVLLQGDRERVRMHADPSMPSAIPVDRPAIRAVGS